MPLRMDVILSIYAKEKNAAGAAAEGRELGWGSSVLAHTAPFLSPPLPARTCMHMPAAEGAAASPRRKEELWLAPPRPAASPSPRRRPCQRRLPTISRPGRPPPAARAGPLLPGLRRSPLSPQRSAAAPLGGPGASGRPPDY